MPCSPAIRCLLFPVSFAMAAYPVSGQSAEDPPTSNETITISPSLRVQTRYAYDEIDGNNDFYIARVRLKARGDVYGVATYYTEVKLDNVGRFAREVNAQVENAWVNFALSAAFAIRIGLYDQVFSRNALTSDSKLLLMDRSLIKDALTDIGFADNTVGVLAHGRPWGGHFEFGAGLFDNLKFEGFGAPTTRQADGAMLTGRVVAHLLDPAPPGGYADYQSSYLGQGRRLSIGFSGGLLARATAGEGPDVDEFDVRAWGADLFFSIAAFTLEAEYGVFIEDSDIDADVDGEGWYLQAGYLVHPRVELAARHQTLDRDDADGRFFNEFRWTSVGFNYYIRGHNLKIQADYTFKHEELDPVKNNLVQVQLQLDF